MQEAKFSERKMKEYLRNTYAIKPVQAQAYMAWCRYQHARELDEEKWPWREVGLGESPVPVELKWNASLVRGTALNAGVTDAVAEKALRIFLAAVVESLRDRETVRLNGFASIDMVPQVMDARRVPTHRRVGGVPYYIGTQDYTRKGVRVRVRAGWRLRGGLN